MKRIPSLLSILISSLLLGFLVFPSVVFAHGGFQKSSGSTVVYITQSPISPLIGERVMFYFALRDEGVKIQGSMNDQNLTNWPVILTLIDTYYGDESKDKIILKKQFQTDVNGNFTFEYTFPKENYFDIDLQYKDKSGKLQRTGFLVQPRKTKLITLEKYSTNPKYLLASFILGGIIFLLVEYIFRKRAN